MYYCTLHNKPTLVLVHQYTVTCIYYCVYSITINIITLAITTLYSSNNNNNPYIPHCNIPLLCHNNRLYSILSHLSINNTSSITNTKLYNNTTINQQSLHIRSNMKALILVGGYGTRLRPLTFSSPKPLVPFINEPIVLHQIRALVNVGVKRIILAVNYQPRQLIEYAEKLSKELNITIEISQEDTPLGTGM